ncbi:MAG: winged helix DNA-binding domain-containing protein [Phototrophicaceae bacterium]
MSHRILTLRELNRTLLARQLLLTRSNLSAVEATEHLIALQSQVPNPPYIGLWSRVEGFTRLGFTQALECREIVRAPFLRSTLHLLTPATYRQFYPSIQPSLVKAHHAFHRTAKQLPTATVVDLARPFLQTSPRTMGEIEAHLQATFPDFPTADLGYHVRTFLPLMQVYPAGTWGSGSRMRYALAEDTLGGFEQVDRLQELFARYLIAFGPASIMDFQTWLGRTKLTETLGTLPADWMRYQDENGVELWDVPNATLMDADTEAPARFIPEYDNLVLAHQNRTRIIADAHRRYVFLSAARVMGTILLDGFVAGVWKFKREKAIITLTIKPFERLTAPHHQAVEEEAHRLGGFIADPKETVNVVFQVD